MTDNTISIQPPPYSDNLGKTILPPPIVLRGELDITYSDRPIYNMYYASILGFPSTVFLWKDQEYIDTPNISKQMAAEKLKNLMGDDPAIFLRGLFPRTLEEDPNGAGTILSGMISALGIKVTAGCSCKANAIKMNTMGNEWCENNMSEILGWLKVESNKRGLPFIETIARVMVNRAISKSKRLLSKLLINTPPDII